MSIFSTFVKTVETGGLTALPGAVETAFTQTKTWLGQLIAQAEANPTYGSAVTTAVADTNTLVDAASEWVGTAISGDLANFSEEVASLITKYAPKVLGGASPVTAAGQTLLSSLVDVGQAVISHEVLALQGASAAVSGVGQNLSPPAPTPPAAQLAA
jgi:hypothetical protein